MCLDAITWFDENRMIFSEILNAYMGYSKTRQFMTVYDLSNSLIDNFLNFKTSLVIAPTTSLTLQRHYDALHRKIDI